MAAFWRHSAKGMPLYSNSPRNSSQCPGRRVRRRTSTSCSPASARGQSWVSNSSNSASGERSDWAQTQKLAVSLEMPWILEAAELSRHRPRFVLGAGDGVSL